MDTHTIPYPRLTAMSSVWLSAPTCSDEICIRSLSNKEVEHSVSGVALGLWRPKLDFFLGYSAMIWFWVYSVHTPLESLICNPKVSVVLLGCVAMWIICTELPGGPNLVTW